MKHHLRRTLSPHILTYEELYTLLTEIEAYLNSRPLCALSSDPFNPTCLSSGHFLIGEPLTYLLSIDYTNVKCNSRSRWETYQQLQEFWKRWSSDYLQGLQQRQRWHRIFPNLQTGSGPTEGGQHETSSLAHSCHYWDASRQGWCSPCSYTEDPNGRIQTPHFKNLPLTAWIVIVIFLLLRWQYVCARQIFWNNLYWLIVKMVALWILFTIFWLYTLSDKNPSSWNFLSPEPEVTWGTVAIIIRVPPLASYCAKQTTLYLLQLAGSCLQGHSLLTYTTNACLSILTRHAYGKSNSPPVSYRSILRTFIPVFCSSQPRKMRFTSFFRCVPKLFPIIM